MKNKKEKREYQRNRYRSMKEKTRQISIKQLKHLFFVWYKNEWKTLKLDNIEVNEKDFILLSKQLI